MKHLRALTMYDHIPTGCILQLGLTGVVLSDDLAVTRARRLGADESKERFEKKLRKIAKATGPKK
jgi:hypothetical protein